MQCCLYRITANEKVLPKCGLLQLHFQLKSKLSNCFFRETKLKKIVETKKQLRLKMLNLSIMASTPHFGNTLLAEGVIISNC